MRRCAVGEKRNFPIGTRNIIRARDMHRYRYSRTVLIQLCQDFVFLLSKLIKLDFRS